MYSIAAGNFSPALTSYTHNLCAKKCLESPCLLLRRLTDRFIWNELSTNIYYGCARSTLHCTQCVPQLSLRYIRNTVWKKCEYNTNCFFCVCTYTLSYPKIHVWQVKTGSIEPFDIGDLNNRETEKHHKMDWIEIGKMTDELYQEQCNTVLLSEEKTACAFLMERSINKNCLFIYSYLYSFVILRQMNFD